MSIYSTKIVATKFGYGIPDDLISNIDSRWIPIGNVKFGQGQYLWQIKRLKHPKRHHYQTCPECGERKKNIRLHYKTYHSEWYYKTFIKPLEKGEIGEIYGVRFIKTNE